MKLRKCKVVDSDQNGTYAAVFHRWGNAVYPTEDSRDFSYSVAIVEDKNGEVTMELPNTIRFLDGGEE